MTEDAKVGDAPSTTRKPLLLALGALAVVAVASVAFAGPLLARGEEVAVPPAPATVPQPAVEPSEEVLAAQVLTAAGRDPFSPLADDGSAGLAGDSLDGAPVDPPPAVDAALLPITDPATEQPLIEFPPLSGEPVEPAAPEPLPAEDSSGDYDDYPPEEYADPQGVPVPQDDPPGAAPADPAVPTVQQIPDAPLLSAAQRILTLDDLYTDAAGDASAAFTLDGQRIEVAEGGQVTEQVVLLDVTETSAVLLVGAAEYLLTEGSSLTLEAR